MPLEKDCLPFALHKRFVKAALMKLIKSLRGKTALHKKPSEHVFTQLSHIFGNPLRKEKFFASPYAKINLHHTRKACITYDSLQWKSSKPLRYIGASKQKAWSERIADFARFIPRSPYILHKIGMKDSSLLRFVKRLKPLDTKISDTKLLTLKNCSNGQPYERWAFGAYVSKALDGIGGEGAC